MCCKEVNITFREILDLLIFPMKSNSHKMKGEINIT